MTYIVVYDDGDTVPLYCSPDGLENAFLTEIKNYEHIVAIIRMG